MAYDESFQLMELNLFAHAAEPIIIDEYSEHATAQRQQLLPIFTIADASIIIAIAQILGRRKDHHSE